MKILVGPEIFSLQLKRATPSKEDLTFHLPKLVEGSKNVYSELTPKTQEK
jgi:hypothetical protein